MLERFVVTGGTGFVGRALVPVLAGRGDVVVLSRRSELPEAFASLPRVRAVAWDAASLGDWAAEVDGAGAVVHLAGEQAVGVRYTPAVKERLWNSRVKSGEALVAAIARARTRPRVLVSASGVDFYPAGLTDEPFDESSAPGDSFLSRLCVAWEDAVRAAEPLGVRVVRLRFGVVLGSGGPLATMVLPFKWFVGGPLGTGKQPFSWVHRDDVVSIVVRCLDDAALAGPVNAVAPETPSQAEFARALGRVLGRPALLPAPSFALRALFGEGAKPILLGRRAVPRRLEEAGFRFRFPAVEAALADALHRT